MGTHGLDVLLVFDPESLLLVDDHQAEVMPGHARLQQPVGAYGDIYRTVLHPLKGLSGLGGVGEARQSPSP